MKIFKLMCVLWVVALIALVATEIYAHGEDKKPDPPKADISKLDLAKMRLVSEFRHALLLANQANAAQVAAIQAADQYRNDVKAQAKDLGLADGTDFKLDEASGSGEFVPPVKPAEKAPEVKK